jgi:hypothetical protein
LRNVVKKVVRPPTLVPRMAEKAAMIELSMGEQENYSFE